MQRLSMACAAFIFAVFAAADNGHAGIIIEAPSIVATPGSSGSFDVTIHNDNAMGGASFKIGGFSLGLSLSGAPGVNFTAVDILTSIGYVFVVSGGPPFSFDAFPNTSFSASDSEFDMSGFREIAPGDSFGLAHVYFTVDASAAGGDRPLILDTFGTSLSDETGIDPVAFQSVNGNVHVNGGVSTVPEPATWVLMSIGLGGAMFASYRRSRRTSSVDPTC